jgi:NDP-sugar pyrophosphorylase family protein
MSRAPSLVVLAAGLARRFGGCKPLAPVGPRGEAIIDLLASDATAAGFADIVVVLHPETGPAIRYHIERCWPSSVKVSFAEQRLPLGTTHAVMASRVALDADAAFAVANADDVYGSAGMNLLVEHLNADRGHHALVGYALRSTVSTGDPLTRGVCDVGTDGALVGITERRHVSRLDEGDHFVAADGLHPDKLDGDVVVSVNLWGFQSAIWEVFDAAMAASGLDEQALEASVAAGGTLPKTEVLLPEVVGAMVTGNRGLPVSVLTTTGRCIGVTHGNDLAAVQAELERQIAWGVRPDRLWGAAS